MTIVFVPIKMAHVKHVAANLREEQILEARSVGKEPLDAILYSVNRSTKSWTAMVDDDIACVFGLFCPDLIGNSATLWMMATPLVAENRFALIRHAKKFILSYQSIYPEINAFCYKRFGKSTKWLMSLGFREIAETGEFAHMRIA